MRTKAVTTAPRALASPPRIKTRITKDIVETATKKNSSHCMIADAIKASHPGLSHVSVDIQTIRATNTTRGERYIWLTPRAAQHLIIDFDQGKKPSPFELRLGAGQTVEARVRSDEEKKKLRATWRKKYRKPKIVRGKGSAIGGNKPDLVGGREPPKTATASRREFGIRGLKA